MSDLFVELTAPNGCKWTQPIGLFINNEFVRSKSGQKIKTIYPADESEIASVYAAGAEDVDIAVDAARKAFRHASWKDLPATNRGILMLKLVTLMEEHKEILATIDTWDNGKPYQAMMADDLPEAIGTIRYYAGYADKTFGQTIDTTPAKFAYTIRQPIGVCGQIIPWNYPLSMACWKLGPALACGCTIVIKAAEQTPLSILYLGKLIKEAGFPPGVVNIINGLGKDAGAALVRHPGIDKIAFTGSTETGRQIMRMASETMKPITLETGGKSPLLVFDDADIEQAAKWAHLGIMSNQGEICTATSRILVQQNIYDKFLQLFIQHMELTSKLGDPFAHDTFQGPQVSKAQFDRVLSYVDIGKAEGATLAAGGVSLPNQVGKGYFIAPTIFTNVTDDMRIYREEIFGPFVVISGFKDEHEVLQRANDTTYGLGAAVFTKNIERGHRLAREIEAGMVWINSSNDCDPRVPFGGWKQSGIGHELGTKGLDAYSALKAVHVNIGTIL